jgi:hypothetical protein
VKWKPFAFNNIRLNIPDAWDLARFSGDSRSGNFLLDDGREPRLEVQWDRARKIDLAGVEKRCILANRRFAVEERIPLGEDRTLFRAVQRGRGEVGVLVQLDAEIERYVVLRFFRPRGNLQYEAARIAEPLAEARKGGAQLWEFFSTRFLLPEDFLLSDGALKVGCMCLKFQREERQLTVWDFSLLDRLEKRKPAAAYACEVVEGEFPKRFRLDAGDAVPGVRESEFCIKGRRRRRWKLSPSKLLFDNSRVWLQGVANRASNRFGLILYQYRHLSDLAWMEGLAPSLRRDDEAKSDET